MPACGSAGELIAPLHELVRSSSVRASNWLAELKYAAKAYEWVISE